jgi:hypothetical protein
MGQGQLAQLVRMARHFKRPVRGNVERKAV